MVLRSRRRSPDWSADGRKELEAKCRRWLVCRGSDPWFDEEEEAAEICQGSSDGVECPMRGECLGMALVNNEQYGVFGGSHLVQRRWIRRNFPMYSWAYPNPIDPAIYDKVPPLSFFEEESADAEEDVKHGSGQKAAS
jgi:hypothetical protein